MQFYFQLLVDYLEEIKSYLSHFVVCRNMSIIETFKTWKFKWENLIVTPPPFQNLLFLQSLVHIFLNQWLKGLFAITPSPLVRITDQADVGRGHVREGNTAETKYLTNFFSDYPSFPFPWQRKARIVTLCLSRTKLQIGHISCDFQSNTGNHKECKCQGSYCCAQILSVRPKKRILEDLMYMIFVTG